VFSSPSHSLAQGYSTARPDGSAAQPRHGLMTFVALQVTTAARLLKQRELLQGSDGVGVVSTKAVVAHSYDGGFGSRPDGPRSGIGNFFILKN
jgi:hypothetical protein